MVGFFLAQDDPEAKEIYKIAKRKSKDLSDIFLFANYEILGSLKVDDFVNAIQVASDVVLQKSIKEGFGLTVTEAMWKEKPVIGGNVGGIKLQIKDGKNGFLVSSPKEAAETIVDLIEDPKLAQKIGRAAKLTAQKKFLTPRLLKDYLNLFKKLT